MGGGTRHYDFAKVLTKRGHKVTVIASSFHYSKYKEMRTYGDKEYLQESYNGVDLVWIKTPPYFGNGASRVKSMLSYTYRVMKYIPALRLEKPDIIIGSSVHLFAVWAAYRLSKRCHTPFVMEVRDLWPQTLIDMGISKWHPFILLLGWLERYLYRKADTIITTLPYAHNYIANYVPREKITWISNGIDLSTIPYIPKEKRDTLTVTYTGSIGVANNMELLIEAAQKLRAHTNIIFRIIGDGAEKERLKNLVAHHSLSNISIEASVPKTEVAQILIQSDVLFLSLKDSPLYKYGISLNKLFDYMAAGRVIIFAGDAQNNPIKDADAGFTIKPDDSGLLAKTILEIYNLPQEERLEIGRKIRKYAEENYSIELLAGRLEKILREEIDNKNG